VLVQAAITANRLGMPEPGDHPIQYPRHMPAGKAWIYLQCQALPREGIPTILIARIAYPAAIK